MSYVKVEDNENLRRDKNTNAVLNVDNSGLVAYRKQREQLKKMKHSASKIEKLESDVQEIKSLLLKLLDREDNK